LSVTNVRSFKMGDVLNSDVHVAYLHHSGNAGNITEMITVHCNICIGSGLKIENRLKS